MINLAALIDDAKCYETVRQMRWSDGLTCCRCDCPEVIERGKDDTQTHCQHYQAVKKRSSGAAKPPQKGSGQGHP